MIGGTNGGITFAEARERLATARLTMEFERLLGLRRLQLWTMIGLLVGSAIMLGAGKFVPGVNQFWFDSVAAVILAASAVAYLWMRSTDPKIATLFRKADIPIDARFRIK
jgi:hypothetical protein